MNIIKNFLGIKTLILVLFLGITSFVISSCSDDDLPLDYKIVFKNDYFETINVEIDTLKIQKLAPNQTSSISLQKGLYEVRCITKSNLLIKSELNLKGKTKEIDIVLNKKGKIILGYY